MRQRKRVQILLWILIVSVSLFTSMHRGVVEEVPQTNVLFYAPLHWTIQIPEKWESKDQDFYALSKNSEPPSTERTLMFEFKAFGEASTFSTYVSRHDKAPGAYQALRTTVFGIMEESLDSYEVLRKEIDVKPVMIDGVMMDEMRAKYQVQSKTRKKTLYVYGYEGKVGDIAVSTFMITNDRILATATQKAMLNSTFDLPFKNEIRKWKLYEYKSTRVHLPKQFVPEALGTDMVYVGKKKKKERLTIKIGERINYPHFYNRGMADKVQPAATLICNTLFTLEGGLGEAPKLTEVYLAGKRCQIGQYETERGGKKYANYFAYIIGSRADYTFRYEHTAGADQMDVFTNMISSFHESRMGTYKTK